MNYMDWFHLFLLSKRGRSYAFTVNGNALTSHIYNEMNIKNLWELWELKLSKYFHVIVNVGYD